MKLPYKDRGARYHVCDFVTVKNTGLFLVNLPIIFLKCYVDKSLINMLQ